MHIDTMFPAPYLRAAELQGQEPGLTISGVAIEKVAQNEEKPVLHFQEGCKGLVLNKTNAKTLAAAYGPDTAGWGGRPVVLFVTQTQRPSGEPCEGIRLRVPVAAPPAAALPTGAGVMLGGQLPGQAAALPTGVPVAPAGPPAGAVPAFPDGIPF